MLLNLYKFSDVGQTPGGEGRVELCLINHRSRAGASIHNHIANHEPKHMVFTMLWEFNTSLPDVPRHVMKILRSSIVLNLEFPLVLTRCQYGCPCICVSKQNTCHSVASIDYIYMQAMDTSTLFTHINLSSVFVEILVHDSYTWRIHRLLTKIYVITSVLHDVNITVPNIRKLWSTTRQ